MTIDSYFKHIEQHCGQKHYNFLKNQKGNLILVLRIVARPWQEVSKAYFMSEGILWEVSSMQTSAWEFPFPMICNETFNDFFPTLT